MKPTKTCNACGQEKALEEFHKRTNGSLIGSCKICRNLQQKAWHAKNRDSQNLKRKNHRRTNLQVDKLRKAKYHAANREAILATKKRYHRTPKGWAASAWSGINSRTINGSHPRWGCPQRRRYLLKGVRVEMIKEDFYSWVADHWREISELWAAGEMPSIERTNPDGHYSHDNIEIISKRENSRRSGLARRKASV